MADEAKIREIRARLGAIAPLTGDGPSATELARYLAVRALERWVREMNVDAGGTDRQQIAVMIAEFAAARALSALVAAESGTADSGYATRVATQIRSAWGDGGAIGEWLWEYLGNEACNQVSDLVAEMAAAQGAIEEWYVAAVAPEDQV